MAPLLLLLDSTAPRHQGNLWHPSIELGSKGILRLQQGALCRTDTLCGDARLDRGGNSALRSQAEQCCRLSNLMCWVCEIELVFQFESSFAGDSQPMSERSLLTPEALMKALLRSR